MIQSHKFVILSTRVGILMNLYRSCCTMFVRHNLEVGRIYSDCLDYRASLTWSWCIGFILLNLCPALKKWRRIQGMLQMSH